MTRAVEPKQSKRQQRIVSRRALSRSRGHYGRASIAGHDHSPNVVAGKRMFQIRGGSQRGDCFVRKFLGQHFGEPRTKLLASQLPALWISFPAYEFELIRAGTAEARHFERQTPAFIRANTDYAANQRALRRPQM